MSEPVYPTVDPAELEPEYSEHCERIGELVDFVRLDDQQFVATQLAIRDREIARLNQELDDYDICRGSVLRKNLESERDAALARVRELEDALHRQERLTIEANESLDRYIESEQELRARIQELQEGNDMACESPPVGCDCPGCSLARELSRG